MATATLPDVPTTPDELEDYVAALFQASGYFVETKAIEKEATEVLELDAVATSYAAQTPDPMLVEAKSGSWGYSDVFKLLGWMTYLDRPRGAFFASKVIKDKNPELVAQRIAAARRDRRAPRRLLQGDRGVR